MLMSLLTPILCTAAFNANGPKTQAEAQPSSHLPGFFEVQGRVGGQYNTSSRFRSIYGNWSPVYQIEVSSGNWNGLYGWLNGGWTGSDGHTRGLHTKTEVSIVPLSAGLKYAFYKNRYAFLYIGAGAALSHLYLHNHSDDVTRYTKQWHWGAVAKSGARFFLPAGTFIELFVDYNYLPFSIHSDTVNVGGLLIGASFGWGL